MNSFPRGTFAIPARKPAPWAEEVATQAVSMARQRPTAQALFPDIFDRGSLGKAIATMSSNIATKMSNPISERPVPMTLRVSPPATHAAAAVVALHP
jgi:hypothetical protein